MAFYFRNASGTLCNYKHLNNNQDYEDYKTNNYIIARNYICKGLNHCTLLT